MATRNFAKKASVLVVFFMAAVMNIFVSACSDPYEHDEMETKSEERIAKGQPNPEPNVPGLKFIIDRDSINNGWQYRSWWTSIETTTNTRAAGELTAQVSHEQDRYAVLEQYRNLSLSYTQANTSAGSVNKQTVIDRTFEKQYRYSQRFNAALEDGNMAYLDWNGTITAAAVRDTLRWFPADSVLSAEVIALENVNKAPMTRAAEYVIGDSVYTKVTWKLHLTTVHLAKNYQYDQILNDTITRYLLVKNNIDSVYVKDKERVILDETTERCSFTIVYVYKNGEKHEAKKTIILNRRIITIPEYEKIVKSFAYNWLHDNALQIGTPAKAENHNEENWKVLGRTDKFSAMITNNTDPITTDYGFYHESAVYQDEDVTVEFDFIAPAMKEKESWVEMLEGDGSYDKARLFNNIDTEYFGYDQTAQETVLLKKVAKAPLSEGWDTINCWEEIKDNKIIWHLVYEIIYNDGESVKTPFEFEDDRILELLSEWESIEDNEKQTTTKASVSKVLGTKEMSDTQKGAVANWVRETREISSQAKLNGSTQNNLWQSIEPTSFKVTYRNQEFSFDRHNISVSNIANVTGGSIIGEYRVYNYGDALTYVYAENSKSLTAPGVIKVLAKQIESEDWVAAQCTETWSDNEVKWHLVYVVKYTTGETDTYTFDCSDERVLEVLSNWSSIETNANQNTGKPVVTITNNTAMSKTIEGAEFNWTRETRSITSTAQLNASSQENKWRAIDPFGMTVTFRGKTFTFDRKNMNVTNGASVSGGNTVGNYKVYNYSDQLTYAIGGNTKNATAPGEIKVLDKQIVEEGWDAASAKQTVTAMMVNWTVDYVVKYNTGKEDRTTYSHSDMRSFTVDTNWSSIEKNNNQNTTSATVTVSKTAAQSQNVNGATFKWTRETRSMKSTAKLNASSQQNGWTAVDPNGCSVTYNGKTFTFDRLTASVSNSAKVQGGSENNGYKVYTYADNLTYVYGGDTKSAAAPGEIKVKVEEPNEPTFFPESWGAIVAAVQTVANNESHKGFVYTWSLRFQNGYVLPVVVRSNATRPEWEFSYVEKTQITTYNGGTYESATNKWINTTAKDQPNHMIWSRSGVEVANKNYNEAANQNWDEGHLINGRPSVNTSRYTLTISNGKLTAKDTYTGHVMGTWSSYTGK